MSKIAIVASTVGYHWEELFAAYDELERAGHQLDLFTVTGALPEVDPMSVKATGPLSLFGLGLPAHISPLTPRGQELLAAYQSVRPVSDLDPAAYDALYLPGGHGCLFDVNGNAELHGKIRELYRQGKLLSGVCHATSTFALVRDEGRSIAQGKQLTGFPQRLDDLLISVGAVDKRFLPLPLSNERTLREAGVDLLPWDPLRGSLNPRHHCISLPFITGVGPKSARPVARALHRELERRAPSKSSAA
jgi:putative intracellular protease/amidase